MERAGLYFKDEPKKPQEMLEDFRAGKFILFKIDGEEAILKKTGPRSAAFILLREPPENFERVLGL